VGGRFVARAAIGWHDILAIFLEAAFVRNAVFIGLIARNRYLLTKAQNMRFAPIERGLWQKAVTPVSREAWFVRHPCP
jgi:hypothetical protein